MPYYECVRPLRRRSLITDNYFRYYFTALGLAKRELLVVLLGLGLINRDPIVREMTAVIVRKYIKQMIQKRIRRWLWLKLKAPLKRLLKRKFLRRFSRDLASSFIINVTYLQLAPELNDLIFLSVLVVTIGRKIYIYKII